MCGTGISVRDLHGELELVFAPMQKKLPNGFFIKGVPFVQMYFTFYFKNSQTPKRAAVSGQIILLAAVIFTEMSFILPNKMDQ